MTRPHDIAAWQTKAETLRSQADRATGELDAAMKRLKREYGVETLAEAETLLAKYQKAEKIAEEDYAEAAEEFENKWADFLEESR